MMVDKTWLVRGVVVDSVWIRENRERKEVVRRLIDIFAEEEYIPAEQKGRAVSYHIPFVFFKDFKIDDKGERKQSYNNIQLVTEIQNPAYYINNRRFTDFIKEDIVYPPNNTLSGMVFVEFSIDTIGQNSQPYHYKRNGRSIRQGSFESLQAIVF